MKKNWGIGSALEILIMLIVLITSISILSRTFAQSQVQSRKAVRLSDAVILASNGAEVFLTGEEPKVMAEILGGSYTDDTVTVFFGEDLRVTEKGFYTLVIEQEEERNFTEGHITVYAEGEQIYTLDTGYAQKGGRP